MSSLFRPGGPFNIEPTGPDQYRLSIPIPPDADGFRAHECPNPTCDPACFKVRPGTGLSGQPQMYCPYCGTAESSQKFFTQEQIRYAKDQVMAEAKSGVSRVLRDALTGPSGRRKVGSGLVSIEWTYREGVRTPVRPPREEPLRRDLVCPHCTLEQAVFGLAIWCSDCGRDIFLAHVAAELKALRIMLAAVPERRQALGSRVAGRDIEDGLENTVSVFEAVLKFITRRHLIAKGKSAAEAEETVRRDVRNAFQSVARGAAVFKDLVGIELFASLQPADLAFLTAAFEKRHPITHNLGVVDKAYITKAISAAREGREVALHADEVLRAVDLSEEVIRAAYQVLFAPPALPTPPSAPPESAAPGSSSG